MLIFGRRYNIPLSRQKFIKATTTNIILSTTNCIFEIFILSESDMQTCLHLSLCEYLCDQIGS